MEIQTLSSYFSPGLNCAVLTFLVILILSPLARHFNLIDHPIGRKNHRLPTPLIGGIAIFLGLSYSLLVLSKEYSLWLSLGVILAVGIMDDRAHLPVKTRLIIHMVAIGFAIFFCDMRLDYVGALFSSPLYLEQFSPLFTLFIVLSFINALNMLDGVDGLLGSIVSGQVLFLLGYSLFMHDFSISVLLISLLLSLVVFLFFNFPFPKRIQARVFLGDAGSTFLAFFIAWIVIYLSQKAPEFSLQPITLFWCVFFPFMEICSVCILKRRKGLSITAASHDHIHYLLMKKGFSKRATVFMIFMLSSFYGVWGILMAQMGIPENIQFLMAWVNVAAYATFVAKINASLESSSLKLRIPEA